MATEPLLPSYTDEQQYLHLEPASYSDEKRPIDTYTPEERNDMIIDDKECDGLRVGEPSFKSRVAERWTETSTKKKALVGILLLMAGITTFMRFHHPRHEWKHHGRPHKDHSEEYENWTPTDDLFVPKHVSTSSRLTL